MMASGDSAAVACGHEFKVLSYTAEDVKTEARRTPDDLCPWSPGRTGDSSEELVTVIHVKPDEVQKCAACKELLSKTFEMPEYWWDDTHKRSNGYFSHDSRRDKDGVLTGYNAFCMFQVKVLDKQDKKPAGKKDSEAKDYKWVKFNVFTQWKAATKQTAILVFGQKTGFPTDLSFGIEPFHGPGDREKGITEKNSPFWPYTRVLREVGNLQNTSIWDIRDQVRHVEKSRPKAWWKTGNDKPEIKYNDMHDLGRHTIHACETLDVSVKTSRMLLDAHAQFMEGLKADMEIELEEDGEAKLNLKSLKRRNALIMGSTRNVHECLQGMEQLIESLRHRSVSNNARLLNEIQLCYTITSEYDTAISVSIAQATRADSADMRTLAYLTLVFLPGTFIAALFGTSFFSFEQDTGTWAVSPKFWIYWVITVPATGVTVLTWLIWHKRLSNDTLLRRATGLNGPTRPISELKKKLKDLVEGLRLNTDQPQTKDVEMQS